MGWGEQTAKIARAPLAALDFTVNGAGSSEALRRANDESKSE